MKNKHSFLKSLLVVCALGVCAPSPLLAENTPATEVAVDDKKMIQEADGTTIQVQPNGSKLIKKPDGTTVEVKADGTKIIKKPDGSVVEVKPGS